MSRLHKFSTSGQPAAGNAHLFQEQMARLFSVGLAISSPDAPFQTQVSGYCGRHLRFAELHFSPHSTSSSTLGGRSSRMLVSLQKRGVAHVQQDGRESRIEVGDMFMIDPARPFSIETGEIVTHSVYLQPETLRSLVPEVDRLTACAIRSNDGAGAMFRGLVDEMFAQADTLDEGAADRISDALPYVLSAALSGMGSDERSPTRVRTMHKQRILRFLRENLRNHELSASFVSAAVNLSTRYIYEIFEEEGQPLMKWIWSHRLERCRNDLASNTLASRSIGEIAYYWGFNDVAHFSRSFRQRFGQSPRGFRAAQQASGTEAAAA
jgi:AraC family transcriptional activator of tynA and feaB